MLKEMNLSDVTLNPFDLIGKDWFLLTSGTPEKYNTMTAGWGTIGFNWGKPVFNCFVRPQRYTYEFMEKNEYFTVSFFSKDNHKILSYCGANSGREVDKAKECGLTPIEVCGSTAFEEAELVFVCRKVYVHDLDESEILDADLDSKWYPQKDYHRSYFGEIVKVLAK